MTGYTSYYDPSLELGVADGTVYNGTKNCFGAIRPLWGLMQPISAVEYNGLTGPEDGFYPITYTENTGDHGWIECK